MFGASAGRNAQDFTLFYLIFFLVNHRVEFHILATRFLFLFISFPFLLQNSLLLLLCWIWTGITNLCFCEVYWRSVRLHGDWRHDYRRPGDPACCGTRDARGVASTRPTPLLLRAVLWRHASVVGADCSADSVARRFTWRSDVILLSPSCGNILIIECCWTAQF